MLDGEWFEDDIVARTQEFIKGAWGTATFDKNVTCLENALEKDLPPCFSSSPLLFYLAVAS